MQRRPRKIGVLHVGVAVFRVIIGKFSHNGQNGAHVILLQQGQRVGGKTGLPVIKGDEHRLIRQGAAPFCIGNQLLGADAFVTMILQILQILLKGFRKNHVVSASCAVGADMMIHQHRKRDGFRGVLRSNSHSGQQREPCQANQTPQHVFFQVRHLPFAYSFCRKSPAYSGKNRKMPRTFCPRHLFF